MLFCSSRDWHHFKTEDGAEQWVSIGENVSDISTYGLCFVIFVSNIVYATFVECGGKCNTHTCC
jgi:hypothetical protein